MEILKCVNMEILKCVGMEILKCVDMEILNMCRHGNIKMYINT